MSTLIEHLATDRVVGRSLILAYGVGLIAGAVLAAAALVALVG
jgi:hypothetical protein